MSEAQQASSSGGQYSSIGRALEILEACAAAEEPLSITEIAKRTRISTSAVHRTCWKLVDLGALTQVGHGFNLGMRVIALGGSSPWLRFLRTEAAPLLHRLASETGLSGNLACLVSGKAMLVDEVFSAEFGVPKELGRKLPLHATAIGKALLVNRSESEIERILGNKELDRYTPATVCDKEQLIEELVSAREQGYVLSKGDWKMGRFGVGAPVLADGVTVASIALIGSLAFTILDGLGERVREAAAQLTAKLSSDQKN
ncbi:IclR family transcriptional regulator [Leucobacter denitrificans]|uniref:IclR family transcriptional regulator n=1 Tax=Leucobacter denitrificans TaxID=683042 RepID=A0A7G9S3E1_9MICO|nr:IclR family transcriptional regulator [Leucobacter denitrificans]QNN62366.1 IclR family transcriptional regulator [Leucobacter denitrificans]